jgi:hypothetical protein
MDAAKILRLQVREVVANTPSLLRLACESESMPRPDRFGGRLFLHSLTVSAAGIACDPRRGVAGAIIVGEVEKYKP